MYILHVAHADFLFLVIIPKQEIKPFTTNDTGYINIYLAAKQTGHSLSVTTQ